MNAVLDALAPLADAAVAAAPRPVKPGGDREQQPAPCCKPQIIQQNTAMTDSIYDFRNFM
jgi:hypothetical protein